MLVALLLVTTRLPAHLDMMPIYGYDPALQANWTTSGISRSLDELRAGFAKTGLRGLLRLDNDDVQPAAQRLFTDDGPLRLVPAWRAVWAARYAAARSSLIGGSLRGVFIGDELTPQGLPFAEFEALVDAIHASFHGDAALPPRSRVIYYNDAIDMRAWPYIPANLTHFSLDYYHSNLTGLDITVFRVYEDFVLPKLRGGTRVLFAPQAYGSRLDVRPGYSIADYERWAVANLTEYVAYASRDARFAGFTPWHLLDRPPPANVTECSLGIRDFTFGCCEVGAESMPRVLAALVELGQQVKANDDERARRGTPA